MGAGPDAPLLTVLTDRMHLMLVTDERLVGRRDWLAVCQAAVAGGVTAVQLRHKTAGARHLVALARRLAAQLPVPVLVNDRLDVALAARAAGVHLGAEDLPPSQAVALRPSGFLVGASVGDDEEVAEAEAADYWGIGPWRSSATKPDAGTALGPEGFRRLVTRGGGRPCLAIGGVRPEDVAPVFAAGGIGVAVVSGILAADDVTLAARRYRDALASAGISGAAG